MNLPKNIQTTLGERTNATWLDSLSGQAGTQAQQNALRDLANHLYVVAYNYLYRRYLYRCPAASATLHSFTRSEIADMAEEKVCRFMEKLVKNDFILLNKFSHKGRFAAWSAAIFLNTMVSEPSRLAWRSHEPLSTFSDTQYIR